MGKVGAASSSLDASVRRSNRVPSKANGSSTLYQPTRAGRRFGSRSRSTYRKPMPSSPSIHLCEQAAMAWMPLAFTSRGNAPAC